MSVIRSFSVHTHCNDLGGKVWNPAIRWNKKYAVFVVLESDSGVRGLGECWCFDAAPDALVAYLRTEIAPHILGCRLIDYSSVYKQLINRATLTARHGILASALSGVDIAVWDIRSRIAEKPLWAFMKALRSDESPLHGHVRLYGSGGLYGDNKSNDDLAIEMRDMCRSGFGVVKMKVGGKTLSEDIDRVLAVLDSLDDSCKLIIDGVYSYSKDDALQLYQALPGPKIEAFQSPLNASDTKGMQELCRAGVPVMATEAEYRDEIHQVLIEHGVVKYLQTAPIACGGITRLNELSDHLALTESQKIKLSLEVSSTAVALAAACHFAAANSEVAHTEYHFVHQVFMDELKLQPVKDKIGWFQLPEAAGIGITLPVTLVETAFELIF